MERSAKAEKKKPPTNGASGNEPHPDFGMAVHCVYHILAFNCNHNILMHIPTT